MVAIRWRQCHSSESACLFVSALVCVSSDVDVFDVDVHWYLILEEECLLCVDTDDLSNGGTLAEGGAKIILFKRRVSSCPDRCRCRPGWHFSIPPQWPI